LESKERTTKKHDLPPLQVTKDIMEQKKTPWEAGKDTLVSSERNHGKME
jgi:hypothetical protein